MRGRYDLVRGFVDFMEGASADLDVSHLHSVMSFIGYDYKKNKEPVESSQDLSTPDTTLED